MVMVVLVGPRVTVVRAVRVSTVWPGSMAPTPVTRVPMGKLVVVVVPAALAEPGVPAARLAERRPRRATRAPMVMVVLVGPRVTVARAVRVSTVWPGSMASTPVSRVPMGKLVVVVLPAALAEPGVPAARLAERRPRRATRAPTATVVLVGPRVTVVRAVRVSTGPLVPMVVMRAPRVPMVVPGVVVVRVVTVGRPGSAGPD